MVGAGPVGLALALHAARAAAAAPASRSSTPARPTATCRADPRTLALSLGSVQFLRRLGAWPAAAAEPILRGARLAGAADAAARLLRRAGGAHPRGRPRRAACSAPCCPTARWWRRCSAPGRPRPRPSRSGCAAASARRWRRSRRCRRAWRSTPASPSASTWRWWPRAASSPSRRARRWCARLRADRLGRQRHAARAPRAAWPSSASRATARPRCCPCQRAGAPAGTAARRWCGACRAPTTRCATLDDAQRMAVLNTLFPAEAGRIVGITPLKSFALGLNAERTLVSGAHGAHRQRRADAAPGGRPGPEPGPARRLRAGAPCCATPATLDAALRRARMGARRRPLER